jgi:flagellar hook-basal body complex protein FliE
MVNPIAGVGAVTAAAPMRTAAAAAPPAESGFGELVQRGLQNVSGLEKQADSMVQDLASGGATRLEDVMIATSQAQLGIELLARVRDKALEAYQEVMRLPV